MKYAHDIVLTGLAEIQNAKFEEVASLPVTGNFLGRIVQYTGVGEHGNGLYWCYDAAGAGSFRKITDWQDVQDIIGQLDVFRLKGALPTDHFPAADAGDVYKVTTAGTVDGVVLQVGDTAYCTVDSTPSATPANWVVTQTNVDQATTTVLGLVMLATQAEVEAKTNTQKAVTPSGLVNFNKTYGADFLIADWVGAAKPFTITITAATHKLGTGKKILISTYESTGDEISVDRNVAANGDVTLSSKAKFDGSYVLTGI